MALRQDAIHHLRRLKWVKNKDLVHKVYDIVKGVKKLQKTLTRVDGAHGVAATWNKGWVALIVEGLVIAEHLMSEVYAQ